MLSEQEQEERLKHRMVSTPTHRHEPTKEKEMKDKMFRYPNEFKVGGFAHGIKIGYSKTEYISGVVTSMDSHCYGYLYVLDSDGTTHYLKHNDFLGLTKEESFKYAESSYNKKVNEAQSVLRRIEKLKQKEKG